MSFLSRTRFLLGLTLILGAFLVSSEPTNAQGAKINKKNVVIKTFDGVELNASLYPNTGGKREGTVILLHDFDLKKGGTIQTQGWTDLAVALQKDGYVVLAFDFRGFGESKTVDPTVFWTKQHNSSIKKKGGNKATTIDAKNFPTSYVPNLLNDIAAVKAYLDRQNDSRDCNTSSTILIGAGEGAALGSIWMGHETRRRRNKNNTNTGIGVIQPRPVLGDLECKDIAAAVWLSISKKGLPSSASNALNNCLVAASRTNKIKVAFVHGKLDSTSDNLARHFTQIINGSNAKTKTAITKEIAGTKLTGDKLLGTPLNTETWIVDLLGKIMDDRGVRERIERKSTSSQYWYVQAGSRNAFPKRLQKPVGEEVGIIDFREIPGFNN